MYVIEKQAAYNIDDNTEICSLSEDTTHAEVLNWLNCSVDEWNAWYKRYMEGEFDIDIVYWGALRQHPTDLETLQDDLQGFYAVVLPSNVGDIFDVLMQYADYSNKHLLEMLEHRILLSMLCNLEYALREYFPDAPYTAVDNILYHA